MLADFGTKPNTPMVHKRFKYWGSGERFLPPPTHKHFTYLQLDMYEVPFHQIVQRIKNLPLRNNNIATSKDGGVVVGQSCKRHDQHTERVGLTSRVSARQNMKSSSTHNTETVGSGGQLARKTSRLDNHNNLIYTF